MTTADALALIEREHGLAGVDARRAWQRRPDARPCPPPPRDGALGRTPRAVRRPGGAGGPRSARGADGDAAPVSRSLRARVAERRRRLEHDADAADRARARAARAAPPLPRRAGPRAPRRASGPAPRLPTRRPPSASCPSGTTCCSPSRTGPRAPGALPEARHPDERRRRADVLVDGLVAGTWLVEDGRVVVAPFGRLSSSERGELEDERQRLEAFLADAASSG